jgi:hypothetical protein
MFKRAYWLVLGYGLGLLSSLFALRWVRRQFERYAPAEVTDRLSRSARGVGSNVKAAVSEGRDTMRRREAEMRGEVTPSQVAGGNGRRQPA